MNPRNIYIKQLFDVITNDEISKDEKNDKAISAINTIITIKPIHDEFKKNNPTVVIDPADEVDLNISDELYRTTLGIACADGEDKIVTALLEAKADPNKATSRGTPLIFAAQEGFTEIVAALLKAGANPNLADEETGTLSLILAAQWGFGETVKKLLEEKADPNIVNKKTGTTPLGKAAQKGFIEIVKTLLEAKANPNTVNKETLLPSLFEAIRHDHRDIVTELLKAKADPNQKNKLSNSSPLIYATLCSPDSVEELLELKPDIDHIDLYQKTALDFAVHQQNIFLVFLLLKSKAKITHFNLLLSFLSSQNQSDPHVFKSLIICKQLNTVLFTHEFTKNNAILYLEKLSYLYENYGMLFATFINEGTSPTFLPKEVKNIIRSYDCRFYQSSAPPIQFLEPTTIDPHLDELNKEIAQKTSQLGLFKSPAIKEMDQSISEEKQSSTKVIGIKRKRE